MIPRLHERTHAPRDPLAEALARPVSPNEGLTEHTAQLASVLAQLADEQAGPLATVRGFVEHVAYRIASQSGAASVDTVHRLELIARRLHAIQQDLDTTAAHLVQRRAATPSAVQRPIHRVL
ncbi:hypothetical protein ACPB9E_16405 [Streptomyces exfoliatus]|uniref:hypothetical protein n=1 Tax=Streptomyces exfoliatus TaxID=1905 RepID=UPI003C2DE863